MWKERKGCSTAAQPEFRANLSLLTSAGEVPDFRFHLNPFAFKNSSTVLNALRNKGAPANDSGLTGPIDMNEYCLLDALKDECGSLNIRYNPSDLSDVPTNS